MLRKVLVRVEVNMKDLFTKKQLEALHKLGSAGLTTKLAQADGYVIDEQDSQEKNLMSVLGQKYFTKKAAMKLVSKGLYAMNKLGK